MVITLHGLEKTAGGRAGFVRKGSNFGSIYILIEISIYIYIYIHIIYYKYITIIFNYFH